MDFVHPPLLHVPFLLFAQYEYLSTLVCVLMRADYQYSRCPLLVISFQLLRVLLERILYNMIYAVSETDYANVSNFR